MEEKTEKKDDLLTEDLSEKQARKFRFNYDKHYKLLLIIPVIILLASLIYLGIFYSKTGDFLYKDVSLSGGTSITINGEIDQGLLESGLKDKFPDVSLSMNIFYFGF